MQLSRFVFCFIFSFGPFLNYLSFQNKVNIKEQLDHIFESELKLLTTSCMIIETEKLGPKLTKVAALVKRYPIHKCGHKEPISGGACFKSMVKINRYFIATQDRELQEWIRKQVGQPLIYLHNVTPVLEAPTDKSKESSANQMENKVNIQESENQKLAKLKKQEGIVEPEIKPKKKKKMKQPNPLSCKKKKPKNDIVDQSKQKDMGVKKDIVKRGKKIKIPRHLRDHMKILKMYGSDNKE